MCIFLQLSHILFIHDDKNMFILKAHFLKTSIDNLCNVASQVHLSCFKIFYLENIQVFAVFLDSSGKTKCYESKMAS